jgi:UTP--glucose-1-phosphate uridylyltransferase
VRDFEERFPAGAPSLIACERLVVEGDVEFGRDVQVRGTVTVKNDGGERLRIEDGTVLA